MPVNDYKSISSIFELRSFYYLLYWVFIVYLSHVTLIDHTKSYQYKMHLILYSLFSYRCFI